MCTQCWERRRGEGPRESKLYDRGMNVQSSLCYSLCLTDDNSIGKSIINKRPEWFLFFLSSRGRYTIADAVCVFFSSSLGNLLISSCARPVLLWRVRGNSKGRIERDPTTEVMRERIIVYQLATLVVLTRLNPRNIRGEKLLIDTCKSFKMFTLNARPWYRILSGLGDSLGVQPGYSNSDGAISIPI